MAGARISCGKVHEIPSGKALLRKYKPRCTRLLNLSLAISGKIRYTIPNRTGFEFNSNEVSS